MKKGIFFIFTLAQVLFASVPTLPMDNVISAEFAKRVNEKPNILYTMYATQFAEVSLKFYEANDLSSAINNHSAATLLAHLGESASVLEADLLAYFFSNQIFLNEFASVLSPKDKLPQVFKILNDIWKASPEDFKAFPNLAVAISIVFDCPPPTQWPHGQVSESALPRKFQSATDAFKMWVSDRRRGKLMLKTEALTIEELKFMVASVATRSEREWAQRALAVNAASIAKLYPSIKYDYQRLNSKQFSWQGKSYTLENIKNEGGICTDQSYYTSEVAKAKGVPAFIFSGAGADGFHAWVAYMLKSGKWNFSVGRYASGNYVTGTTIDPQTWETASSHSLESLREAFRRSQKFRVNEIHTAFASRYLSNNDIAKAKKAIELAIKSDSRNFTSWQIFLDIAKAQNDEKAIDKVCYDAMKAFSRSPDNDAFFRIKMIERLNERGKKADSRKLSNAFVIKNKNNRPDLSMFFARMELLADIKENDVKKLRSSYKRVFNVFKGNLAMTLDGLVIPVLQTLVAEGKTDKVNEIVEQTRQVIKKSKDESIASNFERVLAAFQNAK